MATYHGNITADETDDESMESAKESSFESEEDFVDYETLADWFLRLTDEQKNLRKNCIKIYVLSPFLFGIVPPGHADKLIDWSYECGLLPAKDVQQVVATTNKTFEDIQIVENGFEVLSKIMCKRKEIIHMLKLRDELLSSSSFKAAFACAEKQHWFTTRRKLVRLPKDSKSKVEKATMACLLTIYHYAGHIEQSYCKKSDVLKRHNEECKLAEEKALMLKQQGNKEFSLENYRSAISRYTRAIGLSPFNFIVYGNRAQSYLNLGDYRQALVDAKRAMILKPDWDKGQYRFRQAALALYHNEGSNSSFVFFGVDKDVLAGKNGSKYNDIQDAQKQDLETTKETITKSRDGEDDEDGVPELVSADESDTSNGDSDSGSMKPNMPDLVDNNESDSNESDVEKLLAVDSTKRSVNKKSTQQETKRPKRMSKSNLELLRQQKEMKETEQMTGKQLVTEKKHMKVDKSKKSNEVVIRNGKSGIKDIPLPERIIQIEDILRQASNALIERRFLEASKTYENALEIIDSGPRKSLGYGDYKYVVVLYSYGTALYGIDVYKNIETAKSTFQNILTSFKTINFPLAYYGLAQIYKRENRFPEAVETLQKGLSLINKSLSEIFWPGTDTVIEESKQGNLKLSFEKVLNHCKYPPKPDAICRFENCTGVKKTIYTSDLDYNGYVGILCSEACLIEYHIQCWKKFKSNFSDYSTDKDFLDTNCFTSNCFGEIVGIKIYGADGLKTELHSEKPQAKKENKVSVAVPSKKKKRSRKKEKVTYETDGKDHCVLEEKCSSTISNEKPSSDPPVKEETEKSKLYEKTMEDLTKIPESGMFVLKKEDDQQAVLPTKLNKIKNKKKKTKNVQSLDEFLGPDNEYLRLRPFQHDDENYDAIPSEPLTREAPEGWTSDPFLIPAHLRHEDRAIENSLSQDNMYVNHDPWKNDSMREYIYSAFMNLLKEEGPLHVFSDPMKKLLNMLSEEARILVKNEGGLREFLANSSLFTIEADVISNFKVKLTKPSKKTNEKSMEDSCHDKNTYKREPLTGKKESLKTATNEVHSHNNIKASLSNVSGLSNVMDNHGVSASTTWCTQDNGVPRSMTSNLGNINQSKNTDIDTIGVAEVVGLRYKEVVDIKSRYIASPTNRIDNEKSKDIGSKNDFAVKQIVMNEKEVLETTPGRNIMSENTLPCDLQDVSQEAILSKGKTCVVNDTMSMPVVNHLSKDIETKSTKDKAVLSKPSTKTKITMTDAISDSYEIKYEKLLRSEKGLANKCQELQENFDKMEKKYESELSNLRTKLQDSKQTIEVLSNERQVFEKDRDRLLQALNKEKLEKNKEKLEKNNEIKKLEERFSSAEKSEKKQINVLQAEIAVLEVKYETEKQQLKTEKENVEKIKTYSQQQAKRACDAEIQFLELQRHVNFGFFAKAMQEAELTLHNINQMLAVNSTPQLQGLRQNWQKYLTDCKIHFNQNKEMFESNFQKLKEGSPLSSLTSLRILQPCRFPGPPILQLPPGAFNPPGNQTNVRPEKPIHPTSSSSTHRPPLSYRPPSTHRPPSSHGPPPANKPQPIPKHSSQKLSSNGLPPTIDLPPTIRPPTTIDPPPTIGPSTTIGPQPTIGPPATIRPPPSIGPPRMMGPLSAYGSTSTHEQSFPKPASATPASVPPGAQAFPTNPTSTINVSERVSADVKKMPEQSSKVSKSFEKIMLRLSTLFPNYTRNEMTNFIKEVRASKNGSLTGLSFDDIVACVAQLISERNPQMNVATASAPNNTTTTRSMSAPSKVSVPKQPASITGKPVSQPTKPVFKPVSFVAATVAGAVAHVPSVKSYSDDPCVICHDDMTEATNNVSLDCGHIFHHDCIKKWLTGEQSTCPTCRVHALLPDEFPQLK